MACSRSSSPTSVREPGPDCGPEEPGRDAVDRGERDDRRGLVDERQRGEGPRADEVGDDHQPAPREAVDERAERHPDHDDRHEVRDQERRKPATRSRCDRGCRPTAPGRRDTFRPPTPRLPRRAARSPDFGARGINGGWRPGPRADATTGDRRATVAESDVSDRRADSLDRCARAAASTPPEAGTPPFRPSPRGHRRAHGRRGRRAKAHRPRSRGHRRRP